MLLRNSVAPQHFPSPVVNVQYEGLHFDVTFEIDHAFEGIEKVVIEMEYFDEKTQKIEDYYLDVSSQMLKPKEEFATVYFNQHSFKILSCTLKPGTFYARYLVLKQNKIIGKSRKCVFQIPRMPLWHELLARFKLKKFAKQFEFIGYHKELEFWPYFEEQGKLEDIGLMMDHHILRWRKMVKELRCLDFNKVETYQHLYALTNRVRDDVRGPPPPPGGRNRMRDGMRDGRDHSDQSDVSERTASPLREFATQAANLLSVHSPKNIQIPKLSANFHDITRIFHQVPGHVPDQKIHSATLKQVDQGLNPVPIPAKINDPIVSSCDSSSSRSSPQQDPIQPPGSISITPLGNTHSIHHVHVSNHSPISRDPARVMHHNHSPISRDPARVMQSEHLNGRPVRKAYRRGQMARVDTTRSPPKSPKNARKPTRSPTSTPHGPPQIKQTTVKQLKRMNLKGSQTDNYLKTIHGNDLLQGPIFIVSTYNAPKFIGRNGEKIKRMRKVCKIDLDHFDNEQCGYRFIHLGGSPEERLAAIRPTISDLNAISREDFCEILVRREKKITDVVLKKCQGMGAKLLVDPRPYEYANGYLRVEVHGVLDAQVKAVQYLKKVVY